MKRITDDEGLSWHAFCDAANAPRTITQTRNDMAASKQRQGQSLDDWYEAAVAQRMKGKQSKRKEETPLIEPARKPVKNKRPSQGGSLRSQEPERVDVRKPREILQAPVNSQPSMWEAS